MINTKQLDESLSVEAFEFVLDAVTENASVIDGKVTFDEAMFTQIIATVFELGQREEAASNLEANELVLEAMQKSVDDTTFNGADLMAWIFLLNEYGGTPAQDQQFYGRIFTTIHLPTVGAALRDYHTYKFMLPDGMVEYQIIRKTAPTHVYPATKE